MTVLAAEVLACLDIPRSWDDEAACKGKDQNLFFPSRGDDMEEARAICAGCPIQSECLEYAIAHREHHGVWGGTSERQRRRIVRARRKK